MIIESFEQRILKATDGHRLYNQKAKSIVNLVYLGKEADASEWVEITEEECAEILKQKEAEELLNEEG